MTVLLIIIGFGLTIFVHELGHFLAARAVGVKVKTFCIGMGPRLVRLYRDKHGTDYIIALLPIGGYVEMLGQSDMPKMRPKENTNSSLPVEAYEKGHYLSKKPLEKLLIIIAGVVMNMLFAYLLIVVSYSLGVPFTSNKIGGFLPQSKAPESGISMGDRITHINGKPVKTWEDVITKVALVEDASRGVEVTVKRDDGQKAIHVPLIQAEKKQGFPAQLGVIPYMPAVMDPTAVKSDGHAFLGMGEVLWAEIPSMQIERQTPQGITFLVRTHPGKKVNLKIRKQNGDIINHTMTIPKKKVFSSDFMMMRAVVDVLPGSAVSLGGMQDGDEVIALGDKNILGWKDLTRSLRQIRKKNPVFMKIRREGRIVPLKITPRFDSNTERYVMGVMHSRKFPNTAMEISYMNPSLHFVKEGPKLGDRLIQMKEKKTTIEIIFSRDNQMKNASLSKLMLPEEEIGHLVYLGEPETTLVRYALPTMLYRGFFQTGKELQEVLTFLKRLVTLKISMKMLGGPVRIFEVSYHVKEQKGLAYFILLFAKIGISLAVLNILPLPVLDGGHAVMVIIEMIRRKPLRQEFVNVMQIAGLVLLLSLFIFVFYNDISNLLSR